MRSAYKRPPTLKKQAVDRSTVMLTFSVAEVFRGDWGLLTTHTQRERGVV